MVPAPVPWVNVDSCAELEPDVVASITDLPFDDGSAEWIYAGHVFEHIDWPDAVFKALEECSRVLAMDGHICIVGPDLDRAEAIDGFDVNYWVRMGGGRWPGDEHRWACSERIFLPMIRRVFPDAMPFPIATITPGWPINSRSPWQMAVVA